MAITAKQYSKTFLATEAATEILAQLKLMEASPQYATKSSYKPGSNGNILFSDKHFDYISTHPGVRPEEYLANLRLMTRLY